MRSSRRWTMASRSDTPQRLEELVTSTSTVEPQQADLELPRTRRVPAAVFQTPGTASTQLARGYVESPTSSASQQSSAAPETISVVREPVAVEPSSATPQRHVKKLIVWEGTVSERRQDSFVCRLVDPGNVQPEQIAE